MKYFSTRGQTKDLSFKQAVMMGLAEDGGLLVPEHFPQVSDHLKEWSALSFTDLAYEVMSRFVGEDIPSEDLKALIQRSYASFYHSQITPLVEVGPLHILELFHGPTFAFKDVALQFLGQVFEYFLQGESHGLTVLGATSGDTGSAAIYGLRGKQNIEVVMLHPKGRVTPIQERQMTSVLDANIHNIAIDGTFDDAQAIVKACFHDLTFKQQYHLGAVNSINWARILAQMVYYFYAYFQRIPNADQSLRCVVPSGNFGNVLAGFFAKQMGLPLQLCVATNQNDILHRFFSKGEYHRKEVIPSWSPAMDIQVSSNFERFLFYLSGQDSQQLCTWMESFHQEGQLTLSEPWLSQAKQEMQSGCVSEERVLSTIQRWEQDYQYLLDPHTAVGVEVAEQIPSELPTICIATAHPAKFGEAIQAATQHPPTLPEALQQLEKAPTRCEHLAASTAGIQDYIRQHSSQHKDS